MALTTAATGQFFPALRTLSAKADEWFVKLCEICGEEEPLSVVPWLLWHEPEPVDGEYGVYELKDVEACEGCVGGASVCEAGKHYAHHNDISCIPKIYSNHPRSTIWATCPLHVTECLEQIVDQAVAARLSLSTILEILDNHGADDDEIELMRAYARRLLAPPPVRRGRINTGLAG